MNEYFKKTISDKISKQNTSIINHIAKAVKTAKQYTSIINHIAKEIGLDENEDKTFVITKFDEIKKYFEKLTLPTVQKYSMVLSKLVRFLHLKQETEDEYVCEYLSISARPKTINPRTKARSFSKICY